MPLIHYSTRPVTSDTVKEKEKDQEEIKETGTCAKHSQKEIEEGKSRARARQEKILSALNPNEKVLFQEYIDDLMNPKARGTYEQCATLCIILLACAVLVAVVIYIVNIGPLLVGADL